MKLSLMPKKSYFFTQFDQHATNSLEAAVALERLLTDFTNVESKVRDIHAIEHYGDKLTHEIFKSLNETFVTPLDREDIIGIASKLDDVADVVAGVAEVGKERGKDAGKCTAVDIFGVEGARRKASEFQARSLSHLESFGAEADWLRRLVTEASWKSS